MDLERGKAGEFYGHTLHLLKTSKNASDIWSCDHLYLENSAKGGPAPGFNISSQNFHLKLRYG